MRVEPHGVGSVVHVMKRGARGMPIVRTEKDKIRFAKSLFLLNDTYNDDHWLRDAVPLTLGERPISWPERVPLVNILAWTLMPNHFHLLLEEVTEGGIAKFMQRLCGSMTLCFNAQYNGQGSIFQGGYKGKTIDTDVYLRQVFNYIIVKNVFELHPGGFGKAMTEFDKAWEMATKYQFSSLAATAKVEPSPIINDKSLQSFGLNFPPATFKKLAKETLQTHMQTRSDEFAALLLEKW